MRDNSLFSWIGSGITYVCAMISVQEVSEIILVIVGVISSIVSLAYSIYNWYRKAKSDGKISKDEVEDLGSIIKNGSQDIKDNIDKLNKKEDSKDE